MSSAEGFDVDWLIIGSGFGGSVSALRLAEKGYSVTVLESGRRFADQELPKTSWQFSRHVFAPRLGLKGLLRLTTFKHVIVLSGVGVGGGSLAYAATLYRAPTPYFQHPQWKDLADWETLLAPHYDTAERMLGATPVPFESEGDKWLKEIGAELGCADTFKKTRVGIYFGEPGKRVADPFFGGEGPERTGCIRCGDCMMGCPHGAKNTLVRNYLYFAEKKGVQVVAERTVVDMRPLNGSDGSEGWEIVHQKTGAWFAKDRRVTRARNVIVAAGALGTNLLLGRCKLQGSLPQLSPRVGDLVRTNSETLLSVKMPGEPRVADSVSITGSIFPDKDTHIEAATWGRSADSMGFLFTLLTGPGNRLTRPLKAIGTALCHPLKSLRLLLWPFGWSRKSLGLGLMQTLDNALRFRVKRTLFGGMKLKTEQDSARPIPSYYPIANWMADWLAKRTGGVAQSFLLEALLSAPITAHILGGAVMGKDADHGVVDAQQRVFGYRNLMVCDGSVVPANPGVNPSLTITAMTELAMTHIPRSQEMPRD